MIDRDRLRNIVSDENFVEVCGNIRKGLTGTILTSNTKPETVTEKLADLHALERLIATLHKEAKAK